MAASKRLIIIMLVISLLFIVTNTVFANTSDPPIGGEAIVKMTDSSIGDNLENQTSDETTAEPENGGDAEDESMASGEGDGGDDIANQTNSEPIVTDNGEEVEEDSMTNNEEDVTIDGDNEGDDNEEQTNDKPTTEPDNSGDAEDESIDTNEEDGSNDNEEQATDEPTTEPDNVEDTENESIDTGKEDGSNDTEEQTNDEPIVPDDGDKVQEEGEEFNGEEITEQPIINVTIYYHDENGKNIKEADKYVNVTGYQSYTAPDIEGYLKPDVDSYTVYIFNNDDMFEHTFIYTRYIPTELVNIPDDNLAARIKSSLGLHTENITTNDIARLVNLNIQNENILDFTGIEYATNLKTIILRNNGLENSNITEYLPFLTSLESLEISNNSITDLSSIAGLTQLKKLSLSDNGISDISSLASLMNLEELELDFNNLVDITPLSSLTNLKKINLSYNGINNMEPLAGLVNLNWLMITNNCIDKNIEPNKRINEYFVNNLDYYQLNMQNPVRLSTVTIHYQDDKGNTIKDTDVITKKGDSYYIEAPIIEGYTVVSNGLEWFTVLYYGQNFEYTIVYKNTQTVIPKATVYIYYSDDEGRDIKGGDTYTDVTGTQTYIAPEIEGFIKPSEDTVTFTVKDDNQIFTHVFYYTKIPPAPPIVTKATITIKYVDNEGKTIKEPDVFTEVIGTQSYTAPEIEGFTKPDEDIVTFTAAIGNEILEHIFVYDKIPPVIPKTTMIIYYADNEGNYIKDSDVYKDITGTQTYIAPEIEGYNKPGKDTYTYTVIQYYSEVCHTFVYTKIPPVIPPVDEPDKKPVDKPVDKPIDESVEEPVEKPIEKPIDKPIEKPVEKLIEEPFPIDKTSEKPIEKTIKQPIERPVITVKFESKAEVIINYQDMGGNTIKDSDIYYDVKGTSTYNAPVIDGYTKPINDTITFTVTSDSQKFEHTFIYSEDIPPQVIKGSIKVRYTLDGQLIDSDEFTDLEIGKHIIRAKGFDKYRLVSVTEKKVVLTEDNPNKTIEFELGLIPNDKAKLPVVPICTAVGSLFIVVAMMIRKKNLKIYAVEEAAGDEVDRLLSKRKMRIHSDEVVIDISKELTELTGQKLKVVLSKSLSIKLLDKKLIFMNDNNHFGEITLTEQVNTIEITKDNVVSIIQK